MVDISRSVEVEVSISPFEMGKMFAGMNSHEQARFFNGIAATIENWDKPACFQWQMLRDELERMPEALKCFKGIAEYGPDFEPE